MRTEQRGSLIMLKAEKYGLAISGDTVVVILEGEPYFTLNVRTAVCGDTEDIDSQPLKRSVTDKSTGLTVIWTAVSSRWKKKEYILDCGEDAFLYRVRVTGSGKIGEIRYFSGACVEKRGSEYETSKYFLPSALPGGEQTRRFVMSNSASLGLFYFAPPMFCYPFAMEGKKSWVGLGLAAKRGRYNFDSFKYNYENDRFWLSTDLHQYTAVKDVFETPGILGTFGGDEYQVLSEYGRWHIDSGYSVKNASEKASWWRGPIFCGWGEQCRLSPSSPGNLASQSDYQRMCTRLDGLGLSPTVIIIDDKWQSAYGTAEPDKAKWPDLRGFVREQHEKGRKVVLWFRLWNAEGLPASECIEQLCLPVAADPTNPAYQERVKQMMHTLLSKDEDCFDCDGLKLDFANCMPLGDFISAFEKGVYGVELLKRLFTLIHDAAKKAKPDALINCSSCHPYFAEIADQARLHDYGPGLRSQCTIMEYRQRLFKAALGSDQLIDTDGCNFDNKRDAMRYMLYQPELGVPDLYALPDDLPEEDWDQIRSAWREYKKSL